MENKSSSIKKYILKYGVFLGITTIVFSFLTYLSGDYTDQNLFHAVILSLIAVFCIMMGLILFKKNNYNYINLKEALIIGIGISVFGGFLYAIWKILLTHVFDPDIINELKDKTFKRIVQESSTLTKKTIDRKIKVSEKFSSPIYIIMIQLLNDLFLGFLISLIGGLIIRKKKTPIE